MEKRTMNLRRKQIMALALAICLLAAPAWAGTASWSAFARQGADADADGIPDWKESELYGTDPDLFDTDADGTGDRQEFINGTDPTDPANAAKLAKRIYVSLKYQELRYYAGPYLMDDFLVSTGVPGKNTPAGEFTVTAKVPSVVYQGPDYYYPNTKWNLRFLPGYYIHGAYWHNNFGRTMSHGCVNVSYSDMPALYAWAEAGTPVTVLAGDFPAALAADFPDGTLVLDDGTVFLVMRNKKYGFTSMAAFAGLGYSLSDLKRYSTSGVPAGYVLNSPAMAHVPGSFVSSGRTVYYAAEAGLIPISAWDVFLSVGGGAIVRATAADMARPRLPIMQPSDPRV